MRLYQENLANFFCFGPGSGLERNNLRLFIDYLLLHRQGQGRCISTATYLSAQSHSSEPCGLGRLLCHLAQSSCLNFCQRLPACLFQAGGAAAGTHPSSLCWVPWPLPQGIVSVYSRICKLDEPSAKQGIFWSDLEFFYKGRHGRSKYRRTFSLDIHLSFLVLFHVTVFKMTQITSLWLLNGLSVENEHNGWLTLILWMETLSVIYKQTQMWKRALHEFISFPCQTKKLKIRFFGQNPSLLWGQNGWYWYSLSRFKEKPRRFLAVRHKSASNHLISRMEVWLQKLSHWLFVSQKFSAFLV